jgi:nucleoside-diphosphate-sugar epimerase
VARQHRLLVTGGTGFIGGYCIDEVVHRGDFEVHASCRRAPTSHDPAVRWHTADLLVPGEAERLVREVQPTHLLHLAWYAEPGRYWAAEENYSHVSASLELLRTFVACGGQRVVISGTGTEYDWRYGNCVEDLTPLAADSPYTVCKQALHSMASVMARCAGVSLAWGRVFWLYGPHEHPARLVASVITALLAGDEAKTSPGEQQRPFLHVSDVARAFVALLTSPIQGAVNIAAPEPTRVRDIVELIGRKLGATDRLKIGALPASSNEPPIVIADTRRLRVEVGWCPNYDLETGIADTIEWWRCHSPAKPNC